MENGKEYVPPNLTKREHKPILNIYCAHCDKRADSYFYIIGERLTVTCHGKEISFIPEAEPFAFVKQIERYRNGAVLNVFERSPVVWAL